MSELDSSLRLRRFALLVAVCLSASACLSPVRAVRVDRTVAHRDLTRSAITTGQPSWPSTDALLERGLRDLYDDEPARALAELHQAMVESGGDPNLLFALAELSYLHGQAVSKPKYAMAAAVYAYAFLFPENDDALPTSLDPRVRLAADLYNWSLTSAFASPDGSEVFPRGGMFELPFGWIEVAYDPAEARAGVHELYRFIPVAELEVKGLAMRYRWPGIGAPLAASIVPNETPSAKVDLVAPRLQVALTALLRIDHASSALLQEQPLTSSLELHLAWDADTVEIDGKTVPLENEPTAALALTYTGMPIFQIEIFGFLGRMAGLPERPPLVSTTPHRPGLIPVVFVHGTASSAVRWAELYNRLYADPEIRSRYQFWFFQYESDNPVALSALRLRESLNAAVELLDPDGSDPALRQMVLIGHSQGGLLVKMQSVHTGDAFWAGISDKPIDELRLTDEHRDLLRRALFVDPLPEVSRVIFIATPHRGSFLASKQLVARLLRRLTTMPSQLSALSLDLARNLDASKTLLVPTAVDNMSPRSPFIRSLQEIPIDSSIAAHSIIAVDGDGPIEDGNDGVVEYTSAHIDGVESELVVPSPHSCQGHPDTMEEVRRILLLHANTQSANE